MKKCNKCGKIMKKFQLKAEDAVTKGIVYKCNICGNLEFDQKYREKIIKELEEKSVLGIKQKLIKISHGRLGMYFDQNVVRSAGIKAGSEVTVSVPDKKHILLIIEK